MFDRNLRQRQEAQRRPAKKQLKWRVLGLSLSCTQETCTNQNSTYNIKTSEQKKVWSTSCDC